MNKEQMQSIISDITLPDKMRVRLIDSNTGPIHVQVGMERPDTYTGNIEMGWGGKAFVSAFCTDDELVKKVFGLALAYSEHELRESFKYRGKRVFGPHISLAALMEAADHTTYRDLS